MLIRLLTPGVTNLQTSQLVLEVVSYRTSQMRTQTANMLSLYKPLEEARPEGRIRKLKARAREVLVLISMLNT